MASHGVPVVNPPFLPALHCIGDSRIVPAVFIADFHRLLLGKSCLDGNAVIVLSADIVVFRDIMANHIRHADFLSLIEEWQPAKQI